MGGVDKAVRCDERRAKRGGVSDEKATAKSKASRESSWFMTLGYTPRPSPAARASSETFRPLGIVPLRWLSGFIAGWWKSTFFVELRPRPASESDWGRCGVAAGVCLDL